MKITVENDYEIITVETTKSDVDFNEFMDLIERLSLAVGYSNDIVREYWK